jgi:hypothetical protein
MDRLAIRNHAANQIQRIFSPSAECPLRGKYLPQTPSWLANAAGAPARRRPVLFRYNRPAKLMQKIHRLTDN